MKTIIAGTRTIHNAAELYKAIEGSGFKITEVICGGASGVDELGRLYAINHGIPVKMFLADWATYGYAAGPLRNAQMVEYAEAAIFLWDGESKGTKDCMLKAGHKQIPMYLHKVFTNPVHCKRMPYDVLIDRSTKWGNKFIIGPDGTREEVVEKYKVWLYAQPELVEQVKVELKGKILGCWCAPELCHGDVLAQIANS